ncbi:hypothetical protein IQ230_10980 [Gloeocapsopsis crepidinum LEGE 06123]|uniref:LysR family transcriptional regulator n=2 Tax=Gloeocapsopsis crepidinum TaxID=693223 RepID=A0ABR9US22_9CHRO|nr:hypothetical protein [Gloeocapsopsis crepidinum LEGE 06123]
MRIGLLQPILRSYTPQAGLPIAVVFPQKRYLSAKVRTFVEFMTELTTTLK